MEKPILVFQTDFTYKEGAVCAMYGVVKSVDRSLEIMDGSHELPQYDTWSASYRLYQSMKFWPEGTIFVSVVDPGVGTARRACVAKTADGYYIVTPDNGALTHIKKYVGITEVREIDETINRLKGKGTEGVAIFHGRDLFGYCAARLASGIITYEQVGATYPLDEIVTHPILEPTLSTNKIEGIFEINDPNFGNLWTNIPLSMMSEAGFNYGDMINVEIKHNGETKFNQPVLFHKSFGMAKKGEPIIYNNELMKVSMAVSMGNFVEEYHCDFGSDWTVTFTK
ncbi:SAM hydrolase/SAM-dependent halogenase family protein [Anaerorhabdus sp.]|uniref:SAM hydrolase/SAM-dependent halogenase family protein n=1 Tax=Anaerorhabdus sp. TaxID=1872524 RepID=UPI002B1F5940|nr:SAM-dependent chlorinase/fluorinase [Anaerorhabdus sp.]MEA4875695.1 SAM-dependent chlorinase/fluorinase [Anaerorhabdus sp.]